jgi:hypothetical protein
MRTLFGIGTPRSLKGGWRRSWRSSSHCGCGSSNAGAAVNGQTTISRPRSRRMIVSSCYLSVRQKEPFNHGLLGSLKH